MIKGKITGLRAIEPKDLETLKDWRNDQDFRKYFREFRELNDIDQINWLEKVSKNKNDFMFSIIELSTGKLIGACGLLYTNWIIRSSDFSFYIGKDRKYIDEEYAIDASQTLIEYGFKDLNLNKIWMELYEFDNRKIEFFIKKLRFKKEGILRENCFFDGKYYDSIIISRLKSD